jgi:hypothetical protein
LLITSPEQQGHVFQRGTAVNSAPIVFRPHPGVDSALQRHNPLCVEGTRDPAGLRCHEAFSETAEEQNNRKTRDRFVAEIAEER